MSKNHSPGFLKIAEEARSKIKEVSPQEVHKELSQGRSFVLIDVREDHEWTQGRIPQAIHLGRGILERDIELKIPQTDTPIILYCGGGYRSALAAKSLGLMGYSNVQSLAGGYKGWLELGFETTKEDPQ
jgi:rhodanese-related sulfurtransferase